MRLFWRKKAELEALPDQITGNELIERWHRNADGGLDHLVVDGSGTSMESNKRLGGYILWSMFGTGVLAFLTNAALPEDVSGRGWLIFLEIIIVLGLSSWASVREARDKRVCRVTTEKLTVSYNGEEREYKLTEVVGIQLHNVDQQRIYEERKAKKNQSEPRLMEPFSLDLSLETSLGRENLGSVYGLQGAQKIANSINAAIAFMRGRDGTGKGTVVDPKFQYRRKRAGGIPA